MIVFAKMPTAECCLEHLEGIHSLMPLVQVVKKSTISLPRGVVFVANVVAGSLKL